MRPEYFYLIVYWAYSKYTRYVIGGLNARVLLFPISRAT